MTPQQLQVTVMAVLVKDYRKGVLIGTVERDMQVIVMNCNNNLPWLSGINGTNVFNMTACAGVPFCFNILSNDIDTGQTLTVTWNSGIPGRPLHLQETLIPLQLFAGRLLTLI